jgi:hypothetical protein
MSDALWQTLLATAIFAPSPHNIQPWRMYIRDCQTADLYFDRLRLLPDGDRTGNFLIATAGIFIEALSIVAANYHYQLDFQIDRSAFAAIQSPHKLDRDLIPIARLTLKPNPTLHSHWDNELFKQRRTSRLAYTAPVSRAATAALTRLAQSWQQEYLQIDGASQIEETIDRNIDAVITDFNDRAYRTEILKWLRFSRASAAQTRDGLDARCMNLPPVNFWLMSHFPTFAKLPIFSQLVRRYYRHTLGTIPTLGILAGDFWQPEAAFHAGRFLLQFWLEATRHGLYLQPFGNLVTNDNAARWCRDRFQHNKIWFVFKIGPSHQPPQSYRHHVSHILLPQSPV